MNKNILIVAVMFVILICGCGPSEADIQAAIAQTEAARPTNTATPEPTHTPTHTPQPTATLTPTATKTPRPTLTPTPTIALPDVVEDTLDNPEVLYWEDFDHEVIGSSPFGWVGNPNMPKVSYDLSLNLLGQTVGFYYGETISPNQAVLTRFIFGANPSFTIGFYVAKGRELIPARQPGSRVLNLASRFTPMVTNYVDGEGTIYYFDRQVELEIDHWFMVMIGFTDDQTYFIKVWDPENPELVLSFEEQLADMPSSYTFVYWAGEGSEISIDDFAILKFSSLRAADMQTAIAQTEAARPINTSTPEPTNTPTPTSTPLSITDACLNDLAAYTGMDGNTLKEAIIQDIFQTFPELSLYELPEEFISESFEVSSPVWSPEKSQIAFSAGIGSGEMFINFGIFLLEEGGSQINRLVPDRDAVEALLRTWAEKYGWTEERTNEILEVMGLAPWAFNPVWSPDGQKIEFLFGFGDNRGEIWVINRDGSGLVSLGSGEVLYNGVWSPDSQQIIFTTPGYDKKNQIIRVNADGSELTLLKSEDAYYESPSWSPNGQKIVFVASPEKTLGIREDADIYLMNSDGSDPINLTADLEIGAINPMWSPDGQQILFNSVEYDDYVVNIDGTNLEASTHDLSFLNPDWPQCPTNP